MEQKMSYEEFLVKVKEGIVDDNGECPVTPVLLLLQGKWKTQVLYELCIYDTVRFNQLKKDLPDITNTMLTSTLKELEKDKLIKRKQYNEVPPRVEYSFTEKGKDLMPIFYAMMNFGFQYENKKKK